MILLDTNVLSEVVKPSPDLRVVTWLNNQPRISVWTTSITLLEVQFGLQIHPEGKRRQQLTQNIEIVLQSLIERRIAVFDAAAAEKAAWLTALRHKIGRPGELRDSMIAGIAMATNATLATRNTRHFDDAPIPVVNPWISA